MPSRPPTPVIHNNSRFMPYAFVAPGFRPAGVELEVRPGRKRRAGCYVERLSLAILENHLRQRQVPAMRNRQRNILYAQAVCYLLCDAH